jgi:hypothetical protein
MTANEIIAEIETLPQNERAHIVEYVHRVEDDAVPADFLKAVEELHAGKTIPIEDKHFDQPPA